MILHLMIVRLSNNAKLIALELTTITPAEVSQYPIANLSREEIVSGPGTS